MDRPRTLGDLRASGYRSRSVKDELRGNLIRRLRQRPDGPLFPGIIGYDHTVMPELQNAILSRHDLLLLGLRGQAKTRLLRSLTTLLDDVIPVVAGSVLNDDPLRPVGRDALDRVAREGDSTPIEWLPRHARYHEKLATPDVTVADLIGDVDLIKHASGIPLDDPRVLHYGLIPRSHRGIFCVNELPDLSPKIQVGLFNILEERDLQIRGFPVRLDLDLCLVFSANPEDYTNRGRIVTPLKDRIGSVIRTHYPLTRREAVTITDQNAWSDRAADGLPVFVPGFMKDILEETAGLARTSPDVNQLSGVSVRLSVANRENLLSHAERRALLLGEPVAVPRVCDLACLPAGSRGKLELSVAEDDRDEDPVIAGLARSAVKAVFESLVTPAEAGAAVSDFANGEAFLTGEPMGVGEYAESVRRFPALAPVVAGVIAREAAPAGAGWGEALAASAVEFVLEGLHITGRLTKTVRGGAHVFRR